MKNTGSRDRAHFEAKEQLSGLQIVETSSGKSFLAASGFQYGYLVRLLDDQDLDLIEDPAVRSAVRRD